MILFSNTKIKKKALAMQCSLNPAHPFSDATEGYPY